MEKAIISGVALDTTEAKVTIEGVPDRPGIAAAIFGAMAEEVISVDMIVQNVSHGGLADISFTAPREDLPRLSAVMDRVVKDVGAKRFSMDDDVAKVSLIGAGMKTRPGVAASMFTALADQGVNIEMISTSSIRISCVVRGEDAERAVRAVHEKFGLSEETTTAARDEHAPEPT